MLRCAWGRGWANNVTSASAALMLWKDFSLGSRQAYPLRPLRTALEAVCERLENTGRRRDKTPVEVHEAQEPLQLFHPWMVWGIW